MTLIIPHTFVAGTKAKADEVNANFTAVKNAVDSNTTNISNLTDSVEELDTGKADKVAEATENNLAKLDDEGNLADAGVKIDDSASASTSVIWTSNKVNSEIIANRNNTTVRQTVLQASVDSNGNPDYLTSSGLTLTLNASESDPFIATIANGFDSNGAKDIVINRTSNDDQLLNANSTEYIYINTSGVIGKGSLIPSFGKVFPTPSTGKRHFDLNTYKPYYYSSGNWSVSSALYIAKVTTNATDVTSIQYIPYNGVYYFDDVAISNGTPTILTHGFLCSPIYLQSSVYIKDTSGNYYVPLNAEDGNYENSTFGSLTSQTLTLAAKTDIAITNASTGATQVITSANYGDYKWCGSVRRVF